MEILSSLINILYPNLKCPVCGKFNEGICVVCNSNFKFIENYKLIEKGISLYKYEASALKLLNNYKNKGSFNSLDEIVYRMILKNKDFIDKFDYLIYPPISKKLYEKSGFDYEYELAKSISKKSGIPLIKNMFQNSKFKGKNLKIIKEEDEKNINFNKKLNLSDYKNKKLLIISDIYSLDSNIINCIYLLDNQSIDFKYLTFLKKEERY